MKGRVRDWLPEAYTAAGGCPPAEAFLPSELARANEAERRRIEQHASACPACAAERDLAREFEPSRERIDAARADDIDAIVARLEGGRARPRPLVPWALAAAAVLMLGVAVGVLGVRRSGAPALPIREGGEPILRGGRVEGLIPAGEINALPRELRWERVAGAAQYRIRLLEVDGEVRFETTTTDTRLDLPDSERAGMHPSVAYRWEVVALDATGAQVATSGHVTFRATVGGNRRQGSRP